MPRSLAINEFRLLANHSRTLPSSPLTKALNILRKWLGPFASKPSTFQLSSFRSRFPSPRYSRYIDRWIAGSRVSEKQQSLRLFERQSSTLPGNVKSLLNERLWYIQSIAKVRSNALRLAIPFRVINENLCDKFWDFSHRVISVWKYLLKYGVILISLNFLI